METFAVYLLKSSAWLTGFAIIYFLFLRNERFFFLKRYFLITGIIISFIFPLITIHYQVEVPAPVISNADIVQSVNAKGTEIQQVMPVQKFDYRLILLFLYIAGVLFLLFRIILHIRSLFRTISSSEILNRDEAKLIRAKGFPTSFSFFNFIFINPSVSETEAGEIMNHELVHVRQKHWLDLILVELIRIVQWVNPFAWIYTAFIRLNHEYLADEIALQRTSNPAIYRAALVNQLFSSPVISFSNSFNYSLNKKRFDMMNKIITSPYRKLKILFILPVFTILFYAFAAPEYHYAAAATENTLTISAAPAITGRTERDAVRNNADKPIQQEVKGTVLRPDGKPLEGASIMSTGTQGNSFVVFTGAEGKFSIRTTPEASLLVSCKAYKGKVIKPPFMPDMKITLEIDPDYVEVIPVDIKPAGQQTQQVPSPRPQPLVVVDGVIVEKPLEEVRKDLAYNYGIMKVLSIQESTEKYGEKGKNKVAEITTRKKALEMGLKPPFPRLKAEDLPTFQGNRIPSYDEWLISKVKYPAAAAAKGSQGRVYVNFTVELDGSLSNIKMVNSPDPLLTDAVLKVINSSPKWDPPKNSAVDEAYPYNIAVKFKLPDKVSDGKAYVVVEQMPLFPGGDGELLKFITENTQYPDSAKAKNIQGRVIIRFIVNTEGKAEDIMVMKGVHPLLDAEAIRVVKTLPPFSPGYQGGKPVNVYYMVPITFALRENQQTTTPAGQASTQRPEPLVIVDGTIVEKSYNDVRKELGYDYGIMKFLQIKDATEKYGDKGENGAIEITTRKKAIEMGLKPPFPRLKADDYPTFQGKTRSAFNDWVLSQLKYPPDASANKIQGIVNINFSVELDGSITNIKVNGTPDPVLADAVINVIKASPKWDPPKNTLVDAPFQSFAYVRFTLPDKISDDVPFVVVEQMPQYPGGDAELLNFIKNNVKYPEEAKSKKIEGRVIIRFVVTPEGNVEDLVVLKGVDPPLDAEALRVVGLLKGWQPGMQGGKAVSVYYMVPVTFTLPAEEAPK